MLLTEARERVGGNITTRSGDGYQWEEGPNSFQPSDAMLKAAVRGTAPCVHSRYQRVMLSRRWRRSCACSL